MKFKNFSLVLYDQEQDGGLPCLHFLCHCNKARGVVRMLRKNRNREESLVYMIRFELQCPKCGSKEVISFNL